MPAKRLQAIALQLLETATERRVLGSRSLGGAQRDVEVVCCLPERIDGLGGHGRPYRMDARMSEIAGVPVVVHKQAVVRVLAGRFEDSRHLGVYLSPPLVGEAVVRDLLQERMLEAICATRQRNDEGGLHQVFQRPFEMPARGLLTGERQRGSTR